MKIQPGLVCLLGGGAGIPASSKTHEYLGQHLPPRPRIAVLETPAGFELNSDRVASRLADYVATRLQNHNPRVDVIPARGRGTPFSPDDPAIVTPILAADEIILGPGSPSYGVRQLRDSLAYDYIRARQWGGAILLLSSSATLSFSQHTMPVYEIYKVGEDLHWKAGLNYLADYGLDLTIIPHWDNNDGGAELDTRRCYVGVSRFEKLLALLPADHTILGLDDHTAAILDFGAGTVNITGASGITILQGGAEKRFLAGEQFSLNELGSWRLPELAQLNEPIWAQAAATWAEREAEDSAPKAPAAIIALADSRQQARQDRDWATADELRDQIARAGWHVKDTVSGYELEPAA